MNTLIYQYIDIHMYVCQLNQKNVEKCSFQGGKKTPKKCGLFSNPSNCAQMIGKRQTMASARRAARSLKQRLNQHT